MKRLSRKKLTEKVDVLEQKVKSLQEYIYKDKYLNKYFNCENKYFNCKNKYFNCDNMCYGNYDYVYVSYVKVKRITGDMLLCDIINFSKHYNHRPGKFSEYTLTNGRLIENYEYPISEFSRYVEIEKQVFDDKIKLMTEQKFNVSF